MSHSQVVTSGTVQLCQLQPHQAPEEEEMEEEEEEEEDDDDDEDEEEEQEGVVPHLSEVRACWWLDE